MGAVTLKGFARPVGRYRLNGLSGPDGGDAVTLVGRHVSVSIPNRRHIPEAIEELRSLEKDLTRRWPAD